MLCRSTNSKTTHIETRHENNNHKYITCLSELKRLINIEQHYCDQFSFVEGVTQQASERYVSTEAKCRKKAHESLIKWKSSKKFVKSKSSKNCEYKRKTLIRVQCSNFFFLDYPCFHPIFFYLTPLMSCRWSHQTHLSLFIVLNHSLFRNLLKSIAQYQLFPLTKFLFIFGMTNTTKMKKTQLFQQIRIK